MKTILLITILLCSLTAHGQKRMTVMGDIVVGEVVATADTSREITIKYLNKEATETFVGVLAEGYKQKSMDGSTRELKPSEIPPGMRVRLYYKKKNTIWKIDFLGTDEYARLRAQLNLDSSTPIVRATSDALPSTSPLKVYLGVLYPDTRQALVEWVDKWNRKQGDQYGKLELVPNLAQADVLIAVAEGSDHMVAKLPAGSVYYNGNPITGEWSRATSYLVSKDANGLRVLWVADNLVFSAGNVATSKSASDSIKDALDKRMKARTGPVKK